MGARERTASFKCATDGCREVALYSYRTREEGRRLMERYHNRWSCLRHAEPEAVLSPKNAARETVTTLVAQKAEGVSGLFWGGTRGFAHGRGWKAWANDFPAGTRIVETVTVRVELPEAGACREAQDLVV